MKDKVACIKAMRTLTGMGLKEAHEACHKQGTQEFYVNPNWFSPAQMAIEVETQFQILRNNGCIVGDGIGQILHSMRELAAQALMSGEDEFANEILQLVLVEKLRRAA